MDAVIIVFESSYQLSINWIGNAMNDTIADSVLAIILAAESSPASLKGCASIELNNSVAVDLVSPHAAASRQDRLNRVLLFLEAQFGDAITPVPDGIEIRVDDNESHMAKLDFETMEVECKWEPLDSRVKHIVRRALGVVAPLGIGGVVKEEDLMEELMNIEHEEGNGIKVEEED